MSKKSLKSEIDPPSDFTTQSLLMKSNKIQPQEKDPKSEMRKSFTDRIKIIKKMPTQRAEVKVGDNGPVPDYENISEEEKPDGDNDPEPDREMFSNNSSSIVKAPL